MTRFIFAFFIFGGLATSSIAQQTPQASFGPVVSAYLINLTEELHELEFQIQHQEIGRADYTRSKQRLLIQKNYVEKYATTTSEDIIPELQILTADEITTMLGLPDLKSQNLKVGETLAGKWQIIGVERRGERFFVLERALRVPVNDSRPKPNLRDVIETITIYEPDPEELRQTQKSSAMPDIKTPVTTPEPAVAEIPRPQIRALYLPPYTTKARENRIEGKVILNALFTHEGKLKDLFVVQKLGYGLDESAIEAAKRLTFEPARIDGTPVDIQAQIIYTFTLSHTNATIKPLARISSASEKNSAKGGVH